MGGYVIGIDQGSTKTFGALSDEFGNILATSRTSGADHHVFGINSQISKINDVCSNLLYKTGISVKDICLIFGGLTGIDWYDEKEYLKNEIRKLGYCDTVYVVNDSIAAFRGGSSTSFGAVIIAGTGSNCAVLSPDGKEFIYGYYVEAAIQGAGALGRHVLEAVYKSAVGRLEYTSLTERVMKKSGIKDIDTLLRVDSLNKLEGELIRSFTIDLFDAAYEGDMVSAGIIKGFGTGLASLVNARARIFKMENIEFDVVVSGSIFKGPGTLLFDVVTSEVHVACPRADVINAHYEPVAGAVIMALEKLYGDNTIDFSRNIEESCKRTGLIRYG